MITDGYGYIISSIITGIFGLIILRRQNNTKKKVDAITDQVVNGHKREDGTPINLRDEQDDRHNENTNSLKELTDELPIIRNSLEKIWEVLQKYGTRLGIVEDTMSKAEIARLRKQIKEQDNNDNTK